MCEDIKIIFNHRNKLARKIIKLVNVIKTSKGIISALFIDEEANITDHYKKYLEMGEVINSFKINMSEFTNLTDDTKIQYEDNLHSRLVKIVNMFGIKFLRYCNVRIINVTLFNDMSHNDKILYYTKCCSSLLVHYIKFKCLFLQYFKSAAMCLIATDINDRTSGKDIATDIIFNIVNKINFNPTSPPP